MIKGYCIFTRLEWLIAQLPHICIKLFNLINQVPCLAVYINPQDLVNVIRNNRFHKPMHHLVYMGISNIFHRLQNKQYTSIQMMFGQHNYQYNKS